MPRYKILTWGCQMNEEDSEQMSLYLQEQGYEPAERVEDADVVLLNTCSVRRKPEDKVFSTLGHLRTLKQRKPQMVIGVCGCMAQLRADEIRQKAPFVDMIVGTAHVAQVARCWKRRSRNGGWRCASTCLNAKAPSSPTSPNAR
jgi:tRNA-2-methylthio-N6-dimethylallyladenosine synthase